MLAVYFGGRILRGMANNYIILKFGTRRVLLLSVDGKGATWTRHHDEGHATLAFDGCTVVGSVAVPEGATEPTLNDILTQINAEYAPGYIPIERLPDPTYLGTTSNGIRFIVPHTKQQP
jgi:hypothetical protein